MAEEIKCITPLIKQLFVVAGVSLNMANMGAVMGFPAILLPQLRDPGSFIQVDSSYGTWIASIVGISLILGNFTAPFLMGKFGRKIGALISCSFLLIGWLWILLATNVTSLLIARFLQGLALGINLPLCPILIGELTSPPNRGIFSYIMTCSLTASTMLVHMVGSYSRWQTAALVCAFATAAGLSILIFIPESPSWLADQKRYEDSAKAYNWLRGDAEKEELEKMLEARRNRKEVKKELTHFVAETLATFRKREFYMPVFIMIHLNMLSMWTGMAFQIVYTLDILYIVAGNVDLALHVTLLDIQRFIFMITALVVVKKVKRRTFLFSTVGVNLAAMLLLAAYTFAREKFSLPFDHPAIGIILVHIHMCSLTTGALSLPIVLSGELFPLQFRSLAGGISAIAFSANYFITSKTVVVLLSTIGIYGCYILYSAVTLYCMVVIWAFLPETKDRTLQDIENDFKGRPTSVEEAVTVPLRSDKINVDEEEQD